MDVMDDEELLDLADIVVVGSLNMDLVTTTSHLPNVGETVLGDSFATFVGGKGFNQAVAARRTGSRVAMVGKLGQDDFGSKIEIALTQEGILSKFITRCSETEISTGVAAITVDAVGRNAITVVPGANFQLNVDDVKNATRLIQSAKILLLQLEVPLEVCQEAARLAHAAGVKVILTPAPVPDIPLPAALLKTLDLLVLNEIEVRQLAALHEPDLGIEVAEMVAAQHLIKAAGVKAVVVTLGSKGALWVGQAVTERVEGLNVTAIDTTAAGDTFTGALATALAQSSPLAISEALRFANAAGALAVTRKGASASIPYYPEILSLLQALPKA